MCFSNKSWLKFSKIQNFVSEETKIQTTDFAFYYISAYKSRLYSYSGDFIICAQIFAFLSVREVLVNGYLYSTSYKILLKHQRRILYLFFFLFYRI